MWLHSQHSMIWYHVMSFFIIYSALFIQYVCAVLEARGMMEALQESCDSYVKVCAEKKTSTTWVSKYYMYTIHWLSFFVCVCVYLRWACVPTAILTADSRLRWFLAVEIPSSYKPSTCKHSYKLNLLSV